MWHSPATSRIALPDERRAAALQHLVDRCEFPIVRLYFESSHTNKETAFVVDCFIRLAQVAAVAAFGDDALMRPLFRDSLVRRIDDPSQIAEATSYRVIYIEPAYLIQFID